MTANVLNTFLEGISFNSDNSHSSHTHMIVSFMVL